MSQERFNLYRKHVALAALIAAICALALPANAQLQPTPPFAPGRNHVASPFEEYLTAPAAGKSLFPLDASFRGVGAAPKASVDTLLARAERRLHTSPADALRLAEEALALAQRRGNQRGEATSLQVIGDIHYAQDRLDQALDDLERARRLFEATGDRAGMAGALNRIGNIHTRRGNLPQALRAHLQALDLSEQLEDEEGMAEAFSDIGHVYQRQENAAQAVHYVRRAVRLYEASDNQQGLARAYSNLGLALVDMGAYDEAIPYLRHTLAFSEEAGDPRGTAIAFNNIGVALNRSGHPAEALGYLRKALRMGEEIGFDYLLAMICDELGRSYLALRRLDLALTFAQRSLALGEKAEDAYNIHLSYEVLSRIHAARGEHEQAYAYHQHYGAAKDSLFDAEKAEIISRIQTRHELEGMEQQIETLYQQSRIRVLQSEQRQNVLLGGLGALVLVAGFSFNRYRLKQRANRLLMEKNEEIGQQGEVLRVTLEEKSLMLEEKEVLVKEIHHRVKNNLQILSSMLRLQVQALENPAALAALQNMQARVLSMGLLHQELYGEDNSTHVDMQGYVEKLSRCLLRAFNADGRVHCSVQAHGTQLDADTAVPLGLILNELLSNALKHAFPGEKSGVVRVDLHRTEEKGWYEMTVSDDGIGWSEGPVPEKTVTVGLTLIGVMTRQLRGTMQRTNGVGLTYTMRFKAKGVRS